MTGVQTCALPISVGTLEAADLDGDGDDELLLLRRGGIDVVTPVPGEPAGLRELVADDGLGTSPSGPRLAWDEPAASDASVRIEAPGDFRTYRLRADGRLVLASEQTIPQRVAASADRVRMTSPPVLAVGRQAEGRMLFATEPEALGQRRLRTYLLDPDGPLESKSLVSWALFPGPERVVDSARALLNGAPVLIVTTTSADKLSLLAEKALRVFPLSGDRTRAGDAPLFAAATGINLWQEANPAIVDLNGDGRDDLVLGYWKGLKSAIAALEVYRGGAAPALEKAGSSSFDVEGGDKGFMRFGPDMDGDGRPDLILLADRTLFVFPGTPAGKAIDRPVDSRPSRRIALPADLPTSGQTSVSMGTNGLQIERSAGGLGTPHLVDLDGDGRREVIFAGDAALGAGRVVAVFVRGVNALAASSNISALEKP